MEKKAHVKSIVIVTVGALLAVAAIAAGFILSKYAVINGKLYPRDQYIFDLRGQNISERTYKKFEKRLPGSWVLWDVPFQDGTVSSDTKELTVEMLSDEDVDLLDYLVQLDTVHAEACENSVQLAELQRRHPKAEVIYSVELCGMRVPHNAQSVRVPSLTAADVPQLECLLNLTNVDATGCFDYEMLEELKAEHPEWNLSYAILVGGTTFSRDATSVNAEGGTYEEISGACRMMTDLKYITLTDPKASYEELKQLQNEYPNVKLRWKLDLFGNVYSDSDTEVDISNNIMTLAQAESIASYFPKLEKLIMCDCGIEDEPMAEFRDRKRSEYKVVWMVHFSEKCKARTDETTFMPIKQGEYYFRAPDKLKYMEDMVCLDLGDNGALKSVEFLAYMPNLQYLILTWSDVRDISPIANCKELIYLELDNSAVPDFTPLIGLTKLEDLNLGNTYPSLEPIKQMTWLKNLWLVDRSGTGGIVEAMPNTHVVVGGGATVSYGWRKLPNYYKMRDLLGMYYMN